MSVYPLDDEANIPINPDYIGKWATIVKKDNGSEEPVKVIISKKNDNEYNISFTGEVRELQKYRIYLRDTLKATGFISRVDRWEFMNIEINGQVFISQINYDNNKLSMLPMAESFTNKYIRSGPQLRMALEFHMKTRLYPRYDDDFCLREMVRVN